MNNVEFLATGQIERLGKSIRHQLARLRLQRLKLLAQGAPSPPRNPVLDPLAADLWQMRLRLESLICKVESEPNEFGAKDPVLARARNLLADAAEIGDLVIWFGAELPEEKNAGQGSSGGTA